MGSGQRATQHERAGDGADEVEAEAAVEADGAGVGLAHPEVHPAGPGPGGLDEEALEQPSPPALALHVRQQVDVQVGGGMLREPADVLGRLIVVLAAAYQRLHLGVEALDADLELQRAGREAFDK